ncbi:hypothetical protein VTN02DRAFT_2528 [Thermoascus thermophilus]
MQLLLQLPTLLTPTKSRQIKSLKTLSLGPRLQQFVSFSKVGQQKERTPVRSRADKSIHPVQITPPFSGSVSPISTPLHAEPSGTQQPS